ncbi:hypothetical protein ABZX77_23855 [Streptomyces sp. NPDC004237]|uniref:hypothetical protein n=1 Tax=Streptomyces sp. NPDC004237 TaxID=3154455 RepID=UPI0033AEE949
MKLFKRTLRRTALMAPALALLTIPFSTGTASAATPGWGSDKPDVIGDCNAGKPDLCQYHEVSSWNAPGYWHAASNVFDNCEGTDPATYARSAAYETNTSYTYGTKETFEVSSGFSDKIQLGMKASVESNQSWTVGDKHTVTETQTNTVRAGYKGQYWFQPLWHHSQGWLEVHYGKRVDGHYFWYYPGQGSTGFQITTPVTWPDGTLQGVMKWTTWKC